MVLATASVRSFTKGFAGVSVDVELDDHGEKVWVDGKGLVICGLTLDPSEGPG